MGKYIWGLCALSIVACAEETTPGGIDPYESNAQGGWNITIPPNGCSDVPRSLLFSLSPYARGDTELQEYGTLMYISFPEGMHTGGVAVPSRDRARVFIESEIGVEKFEVFLDDNGTDATVRGFWVVTDDCTVDLSTVDLVVNRGR